MAKEFKPVVITPEHVALYLAEHQRPNATQHKVVDKLSPAKDLAKYFLQQHDVRSLFEALKHKGKKISDKHKLILSKGRIWKRPIGYNGNKSKINHKDSKLVINTETGIYYDNIASAARSVCMPSSSLS